MDIRRECSNGHQMTEHEYFCGECGTRARLQPQPSVATPPAETPIKSAGATVECPRGHTVPATARFCRTCGSPIPIISSQVAQKDTPSAPARTTDLGAARNQTQNHRYSARSGKQRVWLDEWGQVRAMPPDRPVVARESPRVTLGGLQVLDGAGWAPRVGSAASLMLFENRFELRPGAGDNLVSSVQLDSLQDMRVEGHSLTSGGGFIGGGFGAKGALEGIAISTLLNRATTRKRQWVTIELIADDGWVRLQLAGADTIVIRDQLRVLADEVVRRRSHKQQTPDTNADDGLVTSLERLAKLRETSALTDEEFQIAKTRLLNPADGYA
jgi:hypothetical protein